MIGIGTRDRIHQGHFYAPEIKSIDIKRMISMHLLLLFDAQKINDHSHFYRTPSTALYELTLFDMFLALSA